MANKPRLPKYTLHSMEAGTHESSERHSNWHPRRRFDREINNTQRKPAEPPKLRLVDPDYTPPPPPVDDNAANYFGADFFAEAEAEAIERDRRGDPKLGLKQIKITGKYEDHHGDVATSGADETERRALLENIANAPDRAAATQALENARAAGLLPHQNLQEVFLEYLKGVGDSVATSNAFDKARDTGLVTLKDLLPDLRLMGKINRGVLDDIHRKRDEKNLKIELEKRAKRQAAWDALAQYKKEEGYSHEWVQDLHTALDEQEREDAAETDITIPELKTETPATADEKALAIEAFGTPPTPHISGRKQKEIEEMITEEMARPVTAGEQLQNQKIDQALAQRARDLSPYLKSPSQTEYSDEKPVVLSPRVGAALLKLEKTEKAFREQASWNFRDLMEDFHITDFYINDDGSIPSGLLGRNKRAFERLQKNNPTFARRYDEMLDRYMRRAPLTEAEKKTVSELKADGGLPKPEGFLKKTLRRLGWLGAGAATAAGGYGAYVQQQEFNREKTEAAQIQRLSKNQLAELQQPAVAPKVAEVLFPKDTLQKAVGLATDTLKKIPPYQEFTFQQPEVVEGKRVGLQIGRDVTPYLKAVFERLHPGQEQRVPFGDTGRMFINVKKIQGPSGKYHGEFSLFGIEPNAPADLVSQWVAETFGLKQKPKVSLIKEWQSTGLTRPWINGQITYTNDGAKFYGDVTGLILDEHRGPSATEVAQEETLVKAEAPTPLPSLRADFVPQTVDTSGRRVSRSEAPHGPIMAPEFVVRDDRSEAYDEMVDRASIEWERAKQEWTDRRRRSRSENPPPKIISYETPINVRPEDLDRKRGRGKEEENQTTQLLAIRED